MKTETLLEVSKSALMNLDENVKDIHSKKMIETIKKEIEQIEANKKLGSKTLY